LPRAARGRSARRAIAEALDDPGDPLAVEVLAGDDDDAAAAEKVGGRKDPAVPERHDGLASGGADRLEVLEAFRAPAQCGAEAGDGAIPDSRDELRLDAAAPRRTPRGVSGSR